MINLSTASYFERSTQQLGSLREQANKLQDQISTGDRLTRSSDDPVAAARLRILDRRERLAAVDQRNSDAALSDLKLADTALSTMVNIITRAKELALSAANEAQGPEQRALLSAELDTLRESLLSVANSRNASGHALFGGQTGGAAYTLSGTTITYAGTAATGAIDIGEGQQVTPSFTGPEVLNFDQGGTTTDLFALLGNLSAALQDPAVDSVAVAQASLDGLDSSFDKVTTAQTITGARMGWIDMMDTRRQAVGDQVTQEKSDIGSVDPATAMVHLQETLTVLEASQASFVKLSGLSLFNLIR
ncbi:flagellar biosynthesis protein FlgL [Croceibacterium sp. LX-88]|jgi:flagellar hook-associated protein 3 FlgL|uniref:Flagellar biosynthesis protein FlgL n=1 Tax=Croceibacterium selenioxidans TaxID=2838833 RepID=A0ABS5W1U0_9SPHN|nr:flagellar biosynthesis protein FlgL [Croceibacterium selenioxidans]MBT2133200.1 flagellar biosynthesis protein FlgL [Croceibacterium selenioxidans]